MRIAVLVPTYRRPDDLTRCLRALEAQRRGADRVLVVHRADDDASREVADAFAERLPLESVVVERGGQVAALNAGLERVVEDVVAITDDDAAPHPDWLERIEAQYARSSEIGAVGGRDHVMNETNTETSVVGVMTAYGKTIGNHHRGTGGARDVDFLKGANMTYRVSALDGRRFDERLRGTGAQIHNDLAFSLGMRASGRRVVYDPAIAVDHYPAERFDEDGRNERTLLAIENAAYNESLVISEYLRPSRRAAYRLWSFAVGTRVAPGLVQCVRFAFARTNVWRRFLAVQRGRFAAERDRRIAARTAAP